MQDDVERLVERFALKPHPEGGFYREVYRSSLALEHPALPRGAARRSGSTFIYFLLAAGQFSALHRVRASDEIWHLYAGGPLELHTIDDAGAHACAVLSTDVTAGEPAAVVPAGWWQGARLAARAEWAFCGCTVAPGFDFADFEMPAAATLLAAHPRHEAVIRALTRA